jgi:hypothetical protein
VGTGLVVKTVLVRLDDAEKDALNTMVEGGTIEQALSKSGLSKDELTKSYGELTCAMLDTQRQAAKLARDKMIEMADRVSLVSANELGNPQSVGYGSASASIGRFSESELVLRTALLKLTDAEKAAMQTAIDGGTPAQAMQIGGLTEAQMRKLYTDFANTMKLAQREGARLAFDRMLDEPVLMSASAQIDRKRSIGVVPWAELKARKAPVTPEQARQKPHKKSAIARARVYPRADLSLDEWAAKITSVIQKIWEKEMKLLQSHERVTFEEWRTL